MEKRYYWLKLQDGFFGSKRIKKLRKLAGGDTYTIIYLKMQLLAMKKDGIIRWTGLENDFASELALDLDEEPENVAVTLQYLLSCGLAETDDNIAFFFPYAIENTGSETSAAKRMRDMRVRGDSLRNNVTPLLRERYGEKEIEKETEKDKEKDSRRFTPPTVEEVTAYCAERHNTVNAQRFIDHYETVGWKVGKNPMKDWKAAVRTWENTEKKTNKATELYNRSRKDDANMGDIERLMKGELKI